MSSRKDDQIKKKSDYFVTFLIYAVPIVSGMFRSFLLQPENFGALLSNTVLIVFVAGIYYTFLHAKQDYFYQKIKHPVLFWGAYVLSFFFLSISAMLPVGVIWLLVVVFAALDCGLELALANYVCFMIQYAVMVISEEKNVYPFLMYILMGLVVTLLFSQFKEIKALPYLTITLISSNIALQFAVHHFHWDKLKDFALEGAVEVISLLVLVFVGYCYLKSVKTNRRDRNLMLKDLMEPDSELLLRLESYSMSLMAHSMRISQLSEGAARAVGADELLTKAGGLFHEIGRVENEKNYIEAGIRIGRQADFPEDLLAVMRQHSTGYEMPKSVEAAIVMLSDCIVSTSEYLVQTGKAKKISNEKLVQSVFQNRIEKGNLDESGISEEQIECLREYYIQNTFAND